MAEHDFFHLTKIIWIKHEELKLCRLSLKAICAKTDLLSTATVTFSTEIQAQPIHSNEQGELTASYR